MENKNIFIGLKNPCTAWLDHGYKKERKLKSDFQYDPLFFSIIPAINLNFHNGFTLEIEWLFFGYYLDYLKNSYSKYNIK